VLTSGGTCLQAGAFNSDSPLNRQNWKTTMEALDVVVVTAQSFLNIIKDPCNPSKTTWPADVALLVGTLYTLSTSAVCLIWTRNDVLTTAIQRSYENWHWHIVWHSYNYI
jgi:hypothetical protein